MTPQEELTNVAALAAIAIENATSTAELSAVDVEYLGRKGKLTGLLRLIGTLPLDEKPFFGQKVNAEKDRLLELLDSKRQIFESEEQIAALNADALDVTLPGIQLPLGRRHILTRQMDDVKRALIGLGYSFIETAEVEHYHYNFETLNYPPDHPAFDVDLLLHYVGRRHRIRFLPGARNGKAKAADPCSDNRTLLQIRSSRCDPFPHLPSGRPAGS